MYLAGSFCVNGFHFFFIWEYYGNLVKRHFLWYCLTNREKENLKRLKKKKLLFLTETNDQNIRKSLNILSINV